MEAFERERRGAADFSPETTATDRSTPPGGDHHLVLIAGVVVAKPQISLEINGDGDRKQKNNVGSDDVAARASARGGI